MGARYRPPCLARQPRPRCRNGCVACRRGIDAARADHICTVSNDNVGVLHDFLALVVVVQAMLAPTTSRMLTMSASSPYRRRPIVSLVLVLASSCIRGGARARASLTNTTVGRKIYAFTISDRDGGCRFLDVCYRGVRTACAGSAAAAARIWTEHYA